MGRRRGIFAEGCWSQGGYDLQVQVNLEGRGEWGLLISWAGPSETEDSDGTDNLACLLDTLLDHSN